MISLREFFKKGSIFTELNSLGGYPFIGDDSEMLDNMLVINYGDRTLFKPYEDMVISDVAKYLNKLYSVKWAALIVNPTDLNALSNDNTIKTIETNNNNVVTENNKMTNKVSAFNDDTLLDDSGSNADNVATTDYLGDVREVTSKNSYIDLYNNLNLIDKTNILNIVTKDIANYLTILIY